MPDINLLTAQNGATYAHAHPLKAKPAKQWNIKASPSVVSARNPIRSTLAAITSIKPTTTNAIINLGLGDPTHYPLHPPPPAAVSATRTALESGRANGYVLGVGSLSAREAVSRYHTQWDGVKYEPDSIVLTHGVGQGLDLIFSVLFPHAHVQRSNILLPRPVFGQYPTLLANLGVEVRYYDCIEDRDWECDLDMMEDVIDDDTRAILVTNPSNPCGTNFCEEHLRDILSLADKHKVPIIADEIYGHITFDAPFHPLAALSSTVPVLTLSGLSKRFLLPGWRFGWVCLHDPLGVAGAIKDGMAVWANRFFGPSSLSQASLPEILDTPAEWHQEVLDKVKVNAEITYDAIGSIRGLSTVRPGGALYMLIRIDENIFPSFGGSALAFCQALYKEQGVFVLPGECFEAEGYFRVVLASPAHVMQEVGERMAQFCQQHAVPA